METPPHSEAASSPFKFNSLATTTLGTQYIDETASEAMTADSDIDQRARDRAEWARGDRHTRDRKDRPATSIGCAVHVQPRKLAVMGATYVRGRRRRNRGLDRRRSWWAPLLHPEVYQGMYSRTQCDNCVYKTYQMSIVPGFLVPLLEGTRIIKGCKTHQPTHRTCVHA